MSDEKNPCRSKKELARRMSDYFGLKKGHCLHQSTVSNWTRVGRVGRIRQSDSKGNPYVDDNGDYIYKEKVVPFPNSEHILMIKEFFAVDIGFLLGECRSETFRLSNACVYVGLDADSVSQLHVCTGFETAFDRLGHRGFESRDALRRFFNSQEFFAFVASLCDLDSAYKGKTSERKALSDVVKRVGVDLADRALPYVGCVIDEGEAVDQEAIMAAREIEEAIDEGYETRVDSEALYGKARYELWLAFNRLVDEIYPE